MLILMFPSYVSILVFGIARVTLFVKLSLAHPITSYPGSSNEKSAIVYPQVYENRQENPEKILVIDGYSLNLNKASVLADTVLLLEVTANGTAEQYVQGSHYERHLFEDKDKLASLILKPLGGGSYHITGMVNYTHRIEPSEPWERSSQERLAHRLSLIDVTQGTYDVVNNVDNSFKNELRYRKIKNRAPPKSYTVETHFITALKHTSYFGNETEDRVAYAMLFMHAVSLRLQQLEPPARIGLTTIEGLKETPPYINLQQDGRVMIYQTLAALGKHANTSKVHKLADVVYLAVSAGLVKIKNGTNQGSTLGMANVARACMFGNVAIGFDRPATFSGVQTSAHEIAHLLNADHDGYRTAKNCSGKDGYIMSSPRKHGKNSCAFSSCSKKDIASFLTWPYSRCLFEKNACHVSLFPNKAANLPGDVMNGPMYCKEYYREPEYSKSTYIKLHSDIKKCVFRCLVEEKKKPGQLQNRTSFALDGTPCSEAQHPKICRNMVCVKP